MVWQILSPILEFRLLISLFYSPIYYIINLLKHILIHDEGEIR